MLRDKDSRFRWKLLDLKSGKIVSHHTKRKYANQAKPIYCLQHKRNPTFVVPVYIPLGCNVIPPAYIKHQPCLEAIK